MLSVIEIGVVEFVAIIGALTAIAVFGHKALDLISKMWEARNKSDGRISKEIEEAPLRVIVSETLMMLKELHAWHNADDPTGAKRWWIPPDLSKRLANIEKHIEMADTMAMENSRLTGRLDEIQERRLQEQNDLMREMLEFARRFERGMDGQGSGRLPSESGPE